MKLIVGLGNPGSKYEKTRHNLGFIVLEQVLKDYEPVSKTIWIDDKRFKSDVVELDWKPKVGQLEKVILAKPKTFMNNSGMAVGLITSYYKLLPQDIWIIHDDIDLRLGAFRIRSGGGAGGHRGLESVMESVKTEKFWRFRLGIGRPMHAHGQSHEKILQPAVDEYVLASFSASEKGDIKKLIHHASQAVLHALEDGLDSSMNRFNTK